MTRLTKIVFLAGSLVLESLLVWDWVSSWHYRYDYGQIPSLLPPTPEVFNATVNMTLNIVLEPTVVPIPIPVPAPTPTPTPKPTSPPGDGGVGGLPAPTPTPTTPPGGGDVMIAVAGPLARPKATVFGLAIGSVVPGDLFYIDATRRTREIATALIITNSNELVPHYGYWVLNVGIFVKAANNQWENATLVNGDPIPDTYLTLRNTQCIFNLSGGAEYKVSISGGNFYCTKHTQSGIAPKFYLTVD